MMIAKVREGYKQTEVGVIPEDWLVAKFEEVMVGFSSGQTHYRAIEAYCKGNIPWITSGERNYNVITDTIEKITKEATVKTNLKLIPKGTFLIAITGLEAEGTRGSCAITGIEATTNQSCMALYPKPGLLTTHYLFQFYVNYGNWLAFNYCQGTKQQSYTGGIAKKLPIVLPPTIKEQTAIATALSDTDALITSLKKLIEKKRAIKQGAMQELLKPKEGWVVRRLGKIASLQRGFDLPNRDLQQGTYPVVYSNGIVNFHNEYQVKGPGIVTGRSGTIGKVSFIDEDFWPHNTALWVTDFFGNYPKFIYYLFMKIKLDRFATGSGVPTLNRNDVHGFQVPIPDYETQILVARILSDMDTEITALEQKLSKYKLLKQGMMHELLTGKTRLV